MQHEERTQEITNTTDQRNKIRYKHNIYSIHCTCSCQGTWLHQNNTHHISQWIAIGSNINQTRVFSLLGWSGLPYRYHSNQRAIWGLGPVANLRVGFGWVAHFDRSLSHKYGSPICIWPYHLINPNNLGDDLLIASKEK